MSSSLIRAAVILTGAASFSFAADPARQLLPEGTPVRMTMCRTVSSSDAHVGETVDFETLDDVKIGDFVVIPKASTAIATVTEAMPKRRMARGGKLNMNIDYVRLPSGTKLPLRGIQNVKGGGHTGAMTGAMVATGIVFFPAAPLFLFMHGKDITIPKGHEITVYTNTDYDPFATGAGVGPSPAKADAAALSNDDVVKLQQAGFSEQVILDKIGSSVAHCKLDPEDLIALRNAGVSDKVISAMIAASKP